MLFLRDKPLKPLKKLAWYLTVVGLLFTAGITTLVAEVHYVSDQLWLKMYQDSALSRTLPSLKSGDRVEVLQRDDGYANIETSNGTRGWVKSSYLVKDKPAVTRLAEVREELDSLRAKHTDLLLETPGTPMQQSSDAELKGRVEKMEAERDALQNHVNELQMQNTRQVEELRTLQQVTASKSQGKHMILWVLIPLLTLVSGFFIGFKFFENKIKARFGGYNPM